MKEIIARIKELHVELLSEYLSTYDDANPVYCKETDEFNLKFDNTGVSGTVRVEWDSNCFIYTFEFFKRNTNIDLDAEWDLLKQDRTNVISRIGEEVSDFVRLNNDALLG